MLFVLRLVFSSGMVAAVVSASPPPPARHDRPPGVDDQGVCHRAGRRHPGVHRGLQPGRVGHGTLRDDLAKGMGWVINLAVAEWVIRRPVRRRRAAMAMQLRAAP